jgi:malate synthase
VPVAKEIFDAYMPEPNQISRTSAAVRVISADLLTVPTGEITVAGLRWNIDVGLQYLASWLDGNGCVPIYNLMEDAATAEICRTQVWQWLRHGAKFQDGNVITPDFVERIVEEQKGKLKSVNSELAARLLESMMTSRECPDFLTVVAYEHLA